MFFYDRLKSLVIDTRLRTVWGRDDNYLVVSRVRVHIYYRLMIFVISMLNYWTKGADSSDISYDSDINEIWPIFESNLVSCVSDVRDPVKFFW